MRRRAPARDGPAARQRPARTLLLSWAVVGLAATLTVAVALLPVSWPTAQAPTLVYGANGALIATLGPGQSQPLPLAHIPPALQEATIAAEDATFYRNFGIDPLAIARAALADLRAGHVVQGGSTITQQLAKNLFLSPSRTLGRKLLEVLYTLRLEATHSKSQILSMYLNTIYYGEGAYGVGAAAEVYFGRPVQQLNLAQCALLAGLPAAPQAFDPYLHPAAARARQRWVLQRMVAARYLTPAQARAAAAQPLRLRRGSPPGAPAAGYFVQYALAFLGQQDPALEAAVRRGGYRIYTTLDPAAQAAAAQAVAAYLPPGQSDAQGVLQPQGALVAIDPRTGAVRAMVGGRSFRRSPFNRAIYALRQPGSTFKPFLYATVIADGHPVTARLLDAPVTYPGAAGRPYTVHDYGGYSGEPVTIRQAVAESINVVAVKWARIVGPAAVIATARRMGLITPMHPTLPLVLGNYATTPLDLADAYVPLANGGWAIPAWGVQRVVSPAGAVVWTYRPPAPRRALRPGVAYIVTSLLESVMTDGTGRQLLPVVGRPVAGKSGTSNRDRDAWFAGYTPDLVAVVWVGDDTPAPLPGTGAQLAGPIWAHFLALALADTPPGPFPRPADVQLVRVSAVDGLLPNPSSPTVTEVFLRGTAPRRISPLRGTSGHYIGLTGIPGSQITPGRHLGALPLPTVPPGPGTAPHGGPFRLPPFLGPLLRRLQPLFPGAAAAPTPARPSPTPGGQAVDRPCAQCG